MSTDVIEIKHTSHGQPRPYADSEYGAEISVRVNGMLMDGGSFYRELKWDTVVALAKMFVRPFENNPANWASAKLVACVPIGPTAEMVAKAHSKWPPKRECRWAVLIKEAFTD